MATLTAIYCRSATVGGFLIQHADRFGKWSHCGIVTELDTVIEAEAFKGVVETPLAEFESRYPTVEQRDYVQITCANPAAAIDWARSQIGKGYDYLAIFGMLSRESWQDDSRWHCAELLETSLMKAGSARFRDAAWHISPTMSWMTQ